LKNPHLTIPNLYQLQIPFRFPQKKKNKRVQLPMPLRAWWGDFAGAENLPPQGMLQGPSPCGRRE
ncbi:Hypothetical predicted protein, partial [Marmota monax]